MILQALKGYYDRGPDGIAPAGFSEQKISFEVVLREDGTVADIGDLRVEQGRRAVPRAMLVPQPPKRAGRNPPPAFLWDKTGYVFGVESSNADKTLAVENADYRAAFVAYHEKLLAGTDDAGLLAVLAFLRGWSPARYTELRHATEMLDTSVVFRLEFERQFIHERPAARDAWARALQPEQSNSGFCLVTGTLAPVARLHASIKGVAGAQSSGASIVSFNLDAFESYGKEQGANAPVSEAASFAYTTALNHLLSRTSGRDAKDRPIYRNRVQIADATTVFWAEAADHDQAETAETLIAALFNPPGEGPTDDDASATAKLGDVVKAMAAGRPLAEAKPELAADTRFYVLGLSPNAARISVRFWHATTLGDLGAAFQQHWQDMRIEPVPWKIAPAIWRLLVQVAPQGKSENVPPNLAGEVMRAILGRTRYPRTLLSSVIMRIRADGDVNGLRTALTKAILVREGETVPMGLDRNNISSAYRLGRLFAVLEAAQYAGVGKVNANIRDKYISAASATPARVFPLLLRGAQDHLSTARKKNKGGRAYRLEMEKEEIVGGLPAAEPFPTTLTLAEQGLFFVGFYHQQADLRVPRQKDETIDDSADDTTSNDQPE